MKKNLLCLLLICFVVIGIFAEDTKAISVPGSNFNSKMRWLVANAQNNNNYLIEVDTDQSIDSATFSYSNKNNIKITLTSIGQNQIVFKLTDRGGSYFPISMFTIDSGVTLIISDNIVLQDRIEVNSGGNLILNGGKISGNTSYGVSVSVAKNGTFTMNSGEISNNNGSGVFVAGTFTMKGGEISNNTPIGFVGPIGGGVKVENGTFIMNNGKISGNQLSNNGGAGGGVVLTSGTFTMEGGEITGNTAGYASGVYVGEGVFNMNNGKISNNISSGDYKNIGGGIYVEGGTFNMKGGEISGNTASNGGGVFIVPSFSRGGIFTMSGGIISGNNASNGAGVFISRDEWAGANFTMNGGEIFGNNSTSNGGGVYVSGIFNMNGGVIFQNVSSSYGGGVYIGGYSGTFNKTSGTIFGYSSDLQKSNMVRDSQRTILQHKGHAIYVHNSNNSYIKLRDATANIGDKLTFDGSKNPPTFTGEWDWDF